MLWTGGIVSALLIALVATLALIDWNRLRGPVARYASHALQRPVTINGALSVHVFSFSPRVEVHDLTVGAVGRDAPGPMLTVDTLAFEVKLLPLLVGHLNFDFLRAIRPQLVLHRTADGRANWDVGTPGPRASSTPFKMPPIRSLAIENGHVELVDDERGVHVSSSLEASDKAQEGPATSLQVVGKGELNRRPFSFDLHGNSLIAADPGSHYEFEIGVEAGDLHAHAKGEAARAFDFGQVTATLALAGGDLADLYYLTGLALPDTPPYNVSLQIVRDGMRVDLRDIVARLGRSDVAGTLALDLAGARPALSGTLASRELRLADLAAPLGAGKHTGEGLSAGDATIPGKEAPASPDTLLLPDASLQVTRIRGMDADVHYSAATIRTEKTSLSKVAAHITLTEGVLSLAPVVMSFSDGTVNLTARIDGRSNMPQTSLDLKISDVKLEQFHQLGSDPVLTGSLQARAHLSGPGRSVHELAAHAHGTMTFVVPHGEIREALAELTGINVDRGLGLLVFNGKKTSELRCGVASFDVEHGDMTARTFIVDTGSVRITGSGDVELKSEALNLDLKGQPKKVRLVRVRSPVLIRGTLAKPVVRVDIAKTGAQVGVVAALTSVLGPVAAVIALVDPGLAKNVDCGALIEPAQDTLQHPGAAALRTSAAVSP